jgi:hypothetical protein
MAKPQNSKNEPERLPYVKPTILTLKVDVSFASVGTDLEERCKSSGNSEDNLPVNAKTVKKAAS